PAKTVHFQTSDHLQLAGLLYGQGKTAIICSHQSNSSKLIWSASGIPQRLAQRGYLVLAYDFRGYGESASGGTLNYDADLRAAITFVGQQGATRIGLLGASMGGTVSLKVAASEPVSAVITLSAPEHFSGISVSDGEVQAITAPKFFVNSQDDTYAQDTEHMYTLASQPKQLQMYPGLAHGVAIFDGPYGASLTQLLLDFIAQYAPAS
ncbi:MAG TPA: alpha/beta fold hydrolase, partial [Ktedonobacterales bacterium]|nr:alpha/beta fold hydrolase [Ktedonobacterales bacterium]